MLYGSHDFTTCSQRAPCKPLYDSCLSTSLTGVLWPVFVTGIKRTHLMILRFALHDQDKRVTLKPTTLSHLLVVPVSSNMFVSFVVVRFIKTGA